jgi:hypothetical protein
MATLDDLRAAFSAARARVPKETRRCATCRDAKRTHRRGRYDCRYDCTKKGCTCPHYVHDEAARAEYRARYDAWYKDDYKPAQEAYYGASRAEAERNSPAPAPRPDRLGDSSGALDVVTCDSFSALTAKVLACPLNSENVAQWRGMIDGTSTPGGSFDWALGADKPPQPYRLDSIAKWMLTGWTGGVAKVREALGHIEVPALSDVRRRGRWSDVGDVLSLDRLYDGNVERCWRTTHRQRTGAPPRLQILVHGAHHAGIDTETMFWPGAAATALTEAAQAAGYAVAVDVTFACRGYTTGGRASYLYRTRVKDYDAPTNTAALAAMTAHPAAFRVMTFALNLATAIDRVSIGFGTPTTPNTETLRAHDLIDTGSTLLEVPQRVSTRDGAQAWVRETVAYLERIGEGAA